MKPSTLLLTLVLTLGTYAHAAPGSTDAPLAGVAMNTAKRLDARTPLDGAAQPVKLSGVPMTVAVSQGAKTRSEWVSP